jgi:hypothetical protein
MHQYRFDDTNRLRAHPQIEAQSFLDAAKYGKPESVTLGTWLWIPGSPHPISGLPEMSTYKMRTSATIDVRRRSGMTRI